MSIEKDNIKTIFKELNQNPEFNKVYEKMKKDKDFTNKLKNIQNKNSDLNKLGELVKDILNKNKRNKKIENEIKISKFKLVYYFVYFKIIQFKEYILDKIDYIADKLNLP